MAITLKQIAAACAFALAAAGLCAPATATETHPKASKVLKEKAKSSKHKKAKKEDTQQDVADNEPEPDVTDTTLAEYSCELNNKVAIYRNPMDDSHIALRWKNRLHRMDKVGTTTGAQRYENANLGLVWIGIPSKGILLDSKHSRQLANECKDADQAKPVVAAAPAPKNS
jgi:membrane-bound inhibitor of C-type lysozyme